MTEVIKPSQEDLSHLDLYFVGAYFDLLNRLDQQTTVSQQEKTPEIPSEQPMPDNLHVLEIPPIIDIAA